MPAKFQNKYRVEPNRWQLWDYSAPGSYFITICIKNREQILGHVENKKMQLSQFGKLVKTEFLKIPEYHQRVFLDAWVVMPNHVHCIITLGDYDGIAVGGGGGGGDGRGDGDGDPTENQIKQYRKQRRAMLIPKIVGKFQMQTSKQINVLRKTPGAANWQRDYHDHVIRDKDEYDRIKKYIINNPALWNEDIFNK
jgi:REP element-mobilizing transposase RayT